MNRAWLQSRPLADFIITHALSGAVESEPPRGTERGLPKPSARYI